MQLQNCLQITLIAGALVASTGQLAGAELPGLPPIQSPAPTPLDNNEPTASPQPDSPETEPTQALALTEADVVTLLLENNIRFG